MRNAEVDTLSGTDLDLAVALTLGVQAIFSQGAVKVAYQVRDSHSTASGWRVFAPSQRWEDAGEIIERERIAIFPRSSMLGDWSARMTVTSSTWVECDGHNPLTAAMRAFVGSRHGEHIEIEVPQ